MESIQDIDTALSRSVLYSALALALRPPAEECLRRLHGTAASKVLKDGAKVVDRHAPEPRPAPAGDDESSGSPEARTPVVPWVDELVSAARQASVLELTRSYERLFGHTAQGKVPPYETEYGQGEIFRQAQELADLNGFYSAFGLRLPESIHERSDHVAVECEFLSFLCSRKAAALGSDGSVDVEEGRKAERLFLREHLGNFGRTFALALVKQADHPFYHAAGSLLFAFLTSECRRLGVPPGPQYIRLRSTAEMDVPMACGSTCSLAQGGPTPCEE